MLQPTPASWSMGCRALLIALIVPVAPARAQTPGPLVTDRPDQTESAAAIEPGFVQVETGWLFSENDDGGIEVRTHAVPQTLVRIGLVPRLEGRLGFAGWVRAETDTGAGSSSVNGVGDLDIGFKLRVAEPTRVRPAIALLASLTVPTGEEGFGTERADPAVRLAFAHDLTSRVALAYNAGAQWTTESAGDGDEDTLADGLYTIAFGVALIGGLSAFAESFGTFPLTDGSDATHSLDGGLTFLVRDNLQFDVSGGVGLNAAADDWFVSAGLAARLPR